MRAVIYYCKAIKGSKRNFSPYVAPTVLEKRRRLYAKNRIKGVMTYVGSGFLHFLEGHESALKRALFHTFMDPKYNHLSVSLNTPARGRYFADWRMLSLSTVQRYEPFHAFIHRYRDNIMPVNDVLSVLSELTELKHNRT